MRDGLKCRVGKKNKENSILTVLSFCIGHPVWFLLLLSLFMPGVSPLLYGPFRPPFSYFLVPLLFFQILLRGTIMLPRQLYPLFLFVAWCSLDYLIVGGRFTSLLSTYFFVFSLLVINNYLNNLNHRGQEISIIVVVLLATFNSIFGMLEYYIPFVHAICENLTNTSFYTISSNFGGWLGGYHLRSAVLCVEPGFYSAIQVLVLPFAFYFVAMRNNKIVYCFVIVLPICLSLFFSLGRTGWLSLLLGSFLFFLIRNFACLGRILRHGGGLVIVLFFVFSEKIIDAMYLFKDKYIAGQDYSIIQRYESIVGGLELVLKSPVFGVGIGNSGNNNFGVFLELSQWTVNVLNLYVNLATELGVFGLLFFLVFLSKTLDISLSICKAQFFSLTHAAMFSFLILCVVWLNLPDLRMTIFPFVLACTMLGCKQDRGSINA